MYPASLKPFETIASMVSWNRDSEMASPNMFQELKPMGGVRASPLERGSVELVGSVLLVQLRMAEQVGAAAHVAEVKVGRREVEEGMLLLFL